MTAFPCKPGEGFGGGGRDNDRNGGAVDEMAEEEDAECLQKSSSVTDRSK